jgi:hypothetical protein
VFDRQTSFNGGSYISYTGQISMIMIMKAQENFLSIMRSPVLAGSRGHGCGAGVRPDAFPAHVLLCLPLSHILMLHGCIVTFFSYLPPIVEFYSNKCRITAILIPLCLLVYAYRSFDIRLLGARNVIKALGPFPIPPQLLPLPLVSYPNLPFLKLIVTSISYPLSYHIISYQLPVPHEYQVPHSRLICPNGCRFR